MDIRCACGNGFFTKQMKLTKLSGQDGIHEETYYTCTKCGFTVGKKEIRNYPVTKATDAKLPYDVIILFRDYD